MKKSLFMLILLFPVLKASENYSNVSQSFPGKESKSSFDPKELSENFGAYSRLGALLQHPEDIDKAITLTNRTQHLVQVEFFNDAGESQGIVSLDGYYGPNFHDKYNVFEKLKIIRNPDIKMKAYVYNSNTKREDSTSNVVEAIPQNQYFIIETNEDTGETYKNWEMFKGTVEKPLKKLAIVKRENPLYKRPSNC